MKTKRLRLHERNFSNDIRYKGPLSHRHLKIFGWLFLVLAQLAVILKLASKLNPELDYGLYTDIISSLSGLTVPLFLIANFSLILNSQKKYKALLIKYAAFMIGATVLFFYFYEHIIGGLCRTYLGSEEMVFEEYSSLMLPSGYIAFNMFLDLFLCSAFMFFLDYTPSRIFTGKKIIIFRLMALLPVVYEAVSILLKIQSSTRKIVLSPYFFPFLTTKPPMSFLALILLGLIMMIRKRKYMKHGNTLDQYHEFLKTNSNSLSFSIRMAIVFFVISILDLIIAVIMVVVIVGGIIAIESEGAVEAALKIVTDCGFGKSIVLMILSPLSLLYSYNRDQEKTTMFDNAIPLMGVILCIVVYIEGIYRIVVMYHSVLINYMSVLDTMMQTMS